jgi:hypothetical protein
MCPDYRQFSCARCHRQVAICPACDRGQRYCGSVCSQQARRDSLHRAGRRYQQTPAGRHARARRQARYRERQRALAAEKTRSDEEVSASRTPVSEKVTHQSSPPAEEGGRLELPRAKGPRQVENSSEDTQKSVSCHFCGRLCRPVIRRQPLRLRRR